MIAKRPQKGPPKRSDERVAELAAIAEQGRLIQLLHDLSVLVGAACHECGVQHDDQPTPDNPNEQKE